MAGSEADAAEADAEVLEADFAEVHEIGALGRFYSTSVHETWLASGRREWVSVEEGRPEVPWATPPAPSEARVSTATYEFRARAVVIIPRFGKWSGFRVEFESTFRSLRRRVAAAGFGEWTVVDVGRDHFEPGPAGDARLVARCEESVFNGDDYLGGRETAGRALDLVDAALLAACSSLSLDVCDHVLEFAGLARVVVDLRPAVGNVSTLRLSAPRALAPRQVVAATVAELFRLAEGPEALRAVEALAASAHCVLRGDRAETILWAADGDHVVVRDCDSGAFATFEGVDFDEAWDADPLRFLPGVDDAAKVLVHGARVFHRAAQGCEGGQLQRLISRSLSTRFG